MLLSAHSLSAAANTLSATTAAQTSTTATATYSAAHAASLACRRNIRPALPAAAGSEPATRTRPLSQRACSVSTWHDVLLSFIKPSDLRGRPRRPPEVHPS